jgi:hypothetical protein
VGIFVLSLSVVYPVFKLKSDFSLCCCHTFSLNYFVTYFFINITNKTVVRTCDVTTVLATFGAVTETRLTHRPDDGGSKHL